MGESTPISEWKLIFGTIDEIRIFEQEGSTYLRKYSELFYKCYRLTDVAKQDHPTDILIKSLAKAQSDCQNTMHFYMFDAVFFLDINARVTLEHLSRIQKVIKEMTDKNQAIGNGLTHIFQAYAFNTLEQNASSDRAIQDAMNIFPSPSRFADLLKKQLRNEASLTEWITMGLNYYDIPEKGYFPLARTNVQSIREKGFKDDISSETDNISVEDYEKKFLEDYSKQKKMKLHVRRCTKCNYFMTSEDQTEKRCPQCNAPMNFALYCSTCGIWYTVKTPRKYLCPTCGNFLVKKELVQ